jgi:hypothetical protein
MGKAIVKRFRYWRHNLYMVLMLILRSARNLVPIVCVVLLASVNHVVSFFWQYLTHYKWK